MLKIYIDPSFTGTGICSINTTTRDIHFHLLQRAETKRSFDNYYKALDEIRGELFTTLHRLRHLYPSETVEIYLEAPVPTSFSSAGLYALNMFYFDMIVKNQLCTRLYHISPSWIKGAFRIHLFGKAPKRKKGDPKVKPVNITTRMKKEESYKVADSLVAKGYRIHDRSLLKVAGCDVATALMFAYYTTVEKRKWYLLYDLEKGGVIYAEPKPKVKRKPKK